MLEKNLSNLQVDNYDYTKFLKRNSLDMLIENFENNDLYSSFLTDYYGKKADFKLLSNKNLNRFNDKFWLDEAQEAFNSLIYYIKQEEINPNEATQFLPSDKILWGFTIEMKKMVKEEKEKSLSEIDKIKKIEKQKEIDKKIEEKIRKFIDVDVKMSEIQNQIDEYETKNEINSSINEQEEPEETEVMEMLSNNNYYTK